MINRYWTDADIARFMVNVDKLPCGCWFWQGGRSRGAGNKKWYGSFWVFSLCVNPDCIEIVTSLENAARRWQLAPAQPQA